MKVLICGAGKVSRHLLSRLGESWHITLIYKSEDKLRSLIPKFQNIEKVIAADASSPVTLDDAGVGDFDYVLALTENDKVNLAICNYAHSQEVDHILALVNEQENQAKFDEMNLSTVSGSTVLSKIIYYYLQDPRISVTPLTMGQAEIMEVDVSHHFRMVGKRASALMHDAWRLVTILRQNKMVFPDAGTLIQAEDRLVFVGSPDLFKDLCSVLECGYPHFPLAYGSNLLLVLAPGSDREQLIQESMHLAQNTKVRSVTILCSEEERDIQEDLKSWSQTIDLQLETVEDNLLDRIQEFSTHKNYGLMMVHPFEASFFKSLAKPTLISLAHSLPCPLLVARRTQPYERILVPFNATPKAELALDVAVDLARQLKAEVAVAVVQEPEFIHGPQEEEWSEAVLKRVRELAHIHKFDFEEITREGNPVKEIVAVAKDCNLMILGSTTKEKGLFSPHVGELMAQEVPCSVLIVAK